MTNTSLTLRTCSWKVLDVPWWATTTLARLYFFSLKQETQCSHRQTLNTFVTFLVSVICVLKNNTIFTTVHTITIARRTFVFKIQVVVYILQRPAYATHLDRVHPDLICRAQRLYKSISKGNLD